MNWEQALKTDDDGARRRILAAEMPGEARRLGQTVQPRQDREVGGRVGAMVQVVTAKFDGAPLA